jgi:GGDEF domain-containing protein
MRYARTDCLTGILNSRHFIESGEKMLESSTLDFVPFAVCYIDIDNFKLVNDNYGHLVGNMILIDFSDSLNEILSADGKGISSKSDSNCSLIKDACFSGDGNGSIDIGSRSFFGRIGGDEFAFVVKRTNRDELSRLCFDITTLFRKKTLLRSVEAGTSMGCALFTNRLDSFEKALVASDSLMYQVKESGKVSYIIREFN